MRKIQAVIVAFLTTIVLGYWIFHLSRSEDFIDLPNADPGILDLKEESK